MEDISQLVVEECSSQVEDISQLVVEESPKYLAAPPEEKERVEEEKD